MYSYGLLVMAPTKHNLKQSESIIISGLLAQCTDSIFNQKLFFFSACNTGLLVFPIRNCNTL